MTAIETLAITLGTEPDRARRLAIGLAAFDQRCRDAFEAFAPPNRLFERRRIIADLPVPRELAFAIGCLSEGENEAALIFGIIADIVAVDPNAAIDHLIDEAWYYLRTSIDPQWQLDDAPPSVAAAIIYCIEVLDARIARLRALPAARSPADTVDAWAKDRLRALRADFQTGTDPASSAARV